MRRFRICRRKPCRRSTPLRNPLFDVESCAGGPRIVGGGRRLAEPTSRSWASRDRRLDEHWPGFAPDSWMERSPTAKKRWPWPKNSQSEWPGAPERGGGDQKPPEELLPEAQSRILPATRGDRVEGRKRASSRSKTLQSRHRPAVPTKIPRTSSPGARKIVRWTVANERNGNDDGERAR